MATTTIKVKTNNTSGAIPASEDLVVGELAVNLFDKIIFTKQADGTIVSLTPSSSTPPDLSDVAYLSNDQEFTGSNNFTGALQRSGETVATEAFVDGKGYAELDADQVFTGWCDFENGQLTKNGVPVATTDDLSAYGKKDGYNEWTAGNVFKTTVYIPKTAGYLRADDNELEPIVSTGVRARSDRGGVIKYRQEDTDLFITNDGSDA